MSGGSIGGILSRAITRLPEAIWLGPDGEGAALDCGDIQEVLRGRSSRSVCGVPAGLEEAAEAAARAYMVAGLPDASERALLLAEPGAADALRAEIEERDAWRRFTSRLRRSGPHILLYDLGVRVASLRGSTSRRREAGRIARRLGVPRDPNRAALQELLQGDLFVVWEGEVAPLVEAARAGGWQEIVFPDPSLLMVERDPYLSTAVGFRGTIVRRFSSACCSVEERAAGSPFEGEFWSSVRVRPVRRLTEPGHGLG